MTVNWYIDTHKIDTMSNPYYSDYLMADENIYIYIYIRSYVV